MPVRDKAVRKILDLIGADSAPRVMELALYHAADALYTQTLDSIDWKRVMHDAAARHMTLHDGEYLTSGLADEHAVGEVCSECIHEAMLANEWGGTVRNEVWKSRPYALHATLNFSPAAPPEIAALVGWVARRLSKPDPAAPEQLEDDGHLQVCEEVGRRGSERMACHPACPHYDGWIESLA